MCFPYLGLGETGLHLGFGSKHIHASHLTKGFGFGLKFFLLVTKEFGLSCASAVTEQLTTGCA